MEYVFGMILLNKTDRIYPILMGISKTLEREGKWDYLMPWRRTWRGWLPPEQIQTEMAEGGALGWRLHLGLGRVGETFGPKGPTPLAHNFTWKTLSGTSASRSGTTTTNTWLVLQAVVPCQVRISIEVKTLTWEVVSAFPPVLPAANCKKIKDFEWMNLCFYKDVTFVRWIWLRIRSGN
jgi:hypothetical protein